MPEGDTIHKLCAALRPLLEGQRVRSAILEGQPLRSFSDAVVDEVYALGKHLFVVTGDLALRTHLGMHGTWRRFAAGPPPPGLRRASAALRTDRVQLVCWQAKEAELLDRRSHRYRTFVRRLGPDLLDASFDADAALGRAATLLVPAAPLCDLLLDQRVAAGLGNVYKCEVLFLEGLHPLRAWTSVDAPTLRACYDRGRTMLRRNLGPGPRRTRAPSAGSQHGGRVAEVPHYWTYGRYGERCSLCASAIEYRRCGRDHRATYWCPTCQPEAVTEVSASP